MMKPSLFKILSLWKKITGFFMKNQPVNKYTDLEDYLSYYQGLENPRYAVLVTGAWGAGKTFQVRRAISPENHYYVSLFGMKSGEEIEAAVIAAMHPMTAEARSLTDEYKTTSFFGIPIGSIGSILARYILRTKIKSDRTIVFDDLERSRMRPEELLGSINQYVEHHGCRVVVIAHDEKLSDKFKMQKEKIFGQLIRAIPQIDLAYPAFTKELGRDDERKFLLAIQPALITLFNESESNSLRILRHVMEDTLRLMRCLTPKQRNHSQAVEELICLVAALNFECRANRINAADIADRMKQDMAYRMRDRRERGDGVEKPPIVAAIERYKSIRLDSTLLPDDILKQMLFDGIYNAVRISNALNATLYFAEPKVLPSWRAFIGFDDQPDDVAEDARQRLNDDFNERRILEPGDMLHVFALRLMQAAHGLLPLSVAAAAAECRRYVDDLRAGSRLKPLPTAWRERESLDHGHDGIGYWVEAKYKEEWQKVFVYLNEQRQIVMRESLFAAAPRILELVEQDGNALYSLLNHTAENSEEFADVPVLASIDPEQFVNSWLKSHPKNWYWIQSAILERFKRYDKIKNEAEAEWVKKVVALMENEASIATGIRRVRIRRHMPRLSPAGET